MQQSTSPATDYLVKSIEYTIPSSTRAGVFYTVAVNPLSGKAQSCDCPARVVCKHQRLVNRGEAPTKPKVRIAVRTRPVLTPAMRAVADLYA